MYLHLVATLFLTLPAIHGNPVQLAELPRKFSVIFKTSGNDPNHKCPYIRRTKLVTPEPDFITQCTTIQDATSITHLSKSNELNAMCLLYYINFQRLCHLTNRFTSITSPLLEEAVIAKSFEGSQSKLLEVCDTLKNSFVEDKRFQPGIDSIDTHFQPAIDVIKDAFVEKGKCITICADLDDTVIPVCSATAFMVDTTKKLLPPVDPVPSTTERGVTAKPKPYLTEPVAVKTDTHNQPARANELENPGSPVGTNDATELKLDNDGKNLNPVVNGVEAGKSVKNPEVSAPVAHASKENEAGAVMQPPQAQPRGDTEIKSTNLKPEVANQEPRDPATDLEYAMQGEPDRTSPSFSANVGNGQVVEIPVKSQPQESRESTVAKADGDNGNKQPAGPLLQIPERPLFQIPEQPQDPPKDAEKKGEGEAIAPPVMPEDKTQPKVESAQKDQPSGEPVEVKANVPSKIDGGIDPVGDSPAELKDVEQEDADDDTEMGPGNDGDVDYANINDIPPQPKSSEVKPKPVEKPLEIDEDSSSFAVNYQNQNIDDSESYFFSYFMMVCIMFICGYVAYHNKQKILALVVEGRKGRRPSRTRRPNSANYRKLDSNLEEAVTSSCNKNATQVIY